MKKDWPTAVEGKEECEDGSENIPLHPLFRTMQLCPPHHLASVIISLVEKQNFFLFKMYRTIKDLFDVRMAHVVLFLFLNSSYYKLFLV